MKKVLSTLSFALISMLMLISSNLNAAEQYRFCYVDAKDYVFCSTISKSDSDNTKDCELWAQWWIDLNDYEEYNVGFKKGPNLKDLNSERDSTCNYAEDWVF